jgi:hypothetical protein
VVSSRSDQASSFKNHHTVRCAFPSLQFHVEWRRPRLPVARAAELECSLHIHAPVALRTLHSMLLSVLCVPWPRTQRPYVVFSENNDINVIVLGSAGSLSHDRYPQLNDRYRTRSTDNFYVKAHNGDWTRQKAIDSLRPILSLLSREVLTIPNSATGRAESRVKTVKVHFLDIPKRHSFSRWLLHVSVSDQQRFPYFRGSR